MLQKTRRFFLKNVANFVTILGACCGVVAICFIKFSKWKVAVFLMIASVMFDFLDGGIARSLNIVSKKGKYFDSMCDFLNFGVFPAVLLYFWRMHIYGIYGIVITMMFVICVMFRLVRFMSSENTNSNFFIGIPAPMSALLFIMPILLSFKGYYFDLVYIIVYCAIISVLTVSTIPTISLKKIDSKIIMTKWGITVITVILMLFFYFPWNIIIFISVIYFFTIPYSIFSQYMKS